MGFVAIINAEISLDKSLELARAVRGVSRMTINWTANALLFAFAFVKCIRIFTKRVQRVHGYVLALRRKSKPRVPLESFRKNVQRDRAWSAFDEQRAIYLGIRS